jgi:hypothetical protein
MTEGNLLAEIEKLTRAHQKSWEPRKRYEIRQSIIKLISQYNLIVSKNKKSKCIDAGSLMRYLKSQEDIEWEKNILVPIEEVEKLIKSMIKTIKV